MDAKRLIDLVQMVHPVAGTDHLAEVAAAYPDQAVIGLAEKGAGQGQRRIHRIQDIGHAAAPAPGEVVDTVGGAQRPFATILAGQPLGVALVEALGSRAGERIEGGERILWQLAAAGEQRDDTG